MSYAKLAHERTLLVDFSAASKPLVAAAGVPPLSLSSKSPLGRTVSRPTGRPRDCALTHTLIRGAHAQRPATRILQATGCPSTGGGGGGRQPDEHDQSWRQIGKRGTIMKSNQKLMAQLNATTCCLRLALSDSIASRHFRSRRFQRAAEAMRRFRSVLDRYHQQAPSRVC